MDLEAGAALCDRLHDCGLSVLAASSDGLSGLTLVANAVCCGYDEQLVSMASAHGDVVSRYLADQLCKTRKEAVGMQRMLYKHDVALGILATDVAASRTAQNLREELRVERLATAKAKDHAQSLQETLYQMEMDAQAEHAAAALKEDHMMSVSMLSETAMRIKEDELTALKEMLEEVQKAEAKLRCERDGSRDALVEAKAQCEDAVAEARENALRERAERIDAEKALKEELLGVQDQLQEARRDAYGHRIAAEFAEKDRVSDTSEAVQRARALEAELKQVKDELRTERELYAQTMALAKAEKEVDGTRLGNVVKDLQAAADERACEYETLRADFQAKARALEDADAALAAKKTECINLAVRVKVLENQRVHDAAEFEARLAAVQEQGEHRAKTLEVRNGVAVAEFGKKTEEYRVIHNKLKAQVSELQTQIEDKETSILRLDGTVSGTGDLLEAERAAHRVTAAKVKKLEEEASAREKATDSVKGNIHYRILHDQHEQRCEEVKYLSDKITGLEFKLQSLHVDRSVLPRGTPQTTTQSRGTRDIGSAGSRPDAPDGPPATPLHYRRRLEMAELTSRSLDDLLRTVLEELKKPVPVASQDESSTRPDSQTNQRDGAEDAGNKPPPSADAQPPLLHLLTPGTQRDLALLADAKSRKPIHEPTWLDQAPAGKTLAPLPMTPAREDADNSFAGLPRQTPNTVDSSSYFMNQRKKLVPSIYDLDWW
eukprot:TRINITY_DN14564_c0_g1_i1.p1 TRINITY_DN14564_c0_g1~~TRINITY_DN14564_c0_g1_i1.p1  ORF type:complete len:720 (+),score=301.07 TRINITY_DN14564_c0_g1_i1:57-2216(+)